MSREPRVERVHEPTCPYEYAWDVADECGVQCLCPPLARCRRCGRFVRLAEKHKHECPDSATTTKKGRRLTVEV